MNASLIWTVLAFALIYCGFAAICAAMPRHHRQVFGHPLPWRTQIALRSAGSLFLAVSGGVEIEAHGWQLGVVMWFGVAAVAGLALALLFAFLPRFTVKIAPAGLLTGVLLLMASQLSGLWPS